MDDKSRQCATLGWEFQATETDVVNLVIDLGVKQKGAEAEIDRLFREPRRQRLISLAQLFLHVVERNMQAERDAEFAEYLDDLNGFELIPPQP